MYISFRMKAIKIGVVILILILLCLVVLFYFTMGFDLSSKGLFKSRLLYVGGVVQATRKQGRLDNMLLDKDMMVTVQGDQIMESGSVVSGVFLQGLRLVDWRLVTNYGYLIFAYFYESQPHLIALEIREALGFRGGGYLGVLRIEDLDKYLTPDTSVDVLVQYVYPEQDFAKNEYAAYLNNLAESAQRQLGDVNFILGSFGDKRLVVNSLNERLKGKLVWFDSGEILITSLSLEE